MYIAEALSRKETKEKMRMYIAEEHPVKNGKLAEWEDVFILESYYYLRDNKEFPRLINNVGDFLLDSGAFTFMNSTKGQTDFDTYVEEYAHFINKWGVEKFFELDIDNIVGLTEVERLRTKLEMLTGKKPIPVWHKSRGGQYFVEMCKNYPYVAIGGIVTKEIPIEKYEKLFPWFIKTAHENGAKIHGLGYTKIKNLHKYPFDSVDSTAWLAGSKGGFLYRFNPITGIVEQIQNKKSGRLKSNETAYHNFNEWVKFQKYAEKRL